MQWKVNGDTSKEVLFTKFWSKLNVTEVILCHANNLFQILHSKPLRIQIQQIKALEKGVEYV